MACTLCLSLSCPQRSPKLLFEILFKDFDFVEICLSKVFEVELDVVGREGSGLVVYWSSASKLMADVHVGNISMAIDTEYRDGTISQSSELLCDGEGVFVLLF